jgi:hypothetical protein
MPEKVSFGKKLGIAGKDTVAMSLIAKGVEFMGQGKYEFAALFLALGFGLFFVQQYL